MNRNVIEITNGIGNALEMLGIFYKYSNIIKVGLPQGIYNYVNVKYRKDTDVTHIFGGEIVIIQKQGVILVEWEKRNERN